MTHTMIHTRAAAALLLSLVLVAARVPAVGADSLTMPVSYSVGSQPWGVAVADVDGGGEVDIAVSNRGDHTVAVLYGNGDGTFGNAEEHAVGADPWAVTAADFDGDAYCDLAVANYVDNSISLLFGGPDGFAAAVEHVLGDVGEPVAVGSADFDGDSTPDLVIADVVDIGDIGDISICRVGILMNLGSRSFASTVYYEVSGYPVSLVIGNFDGVNGNDIAVACTGDNVVSVLLNNGDGTFATAADYATGSSPVWVTAGDFDGDGYDDLATANAEGDSVSILLNNGDGTFAAATDIDMGAGTAPAGVVAGNFDDDEPPLVDLAVANHNTKSVTLLTGDGAGGFTAGGDFSVGQYPAALGTGDFDSDGRSDVVVVNYGANSVSIMLSAELDVLSIDLEAGWNMVSIPLTLPDMSVGAVFPSRLAVYTWDPGNKSYTQPTVIEPEKAYWVAVAQAETVNLRGTGAPTVSTGVLAGWNMVGSAFGGAVPVGELDDGGSGSVQTNAIYNWNPEAKAYGVASSIQPGKGYWVAATANCTLDFGTT
jgi:hypothetical protein